MQNVFYANCLRKKMFYQMTLAMLWWEPVKFPLISFTALCLCLFMYVEKVCFIFIITSIHSLQKKSSRRWGREEILFAWISFRWKTEQSSFLISFSVHHIELLQSSAISKSINRELQKIMKLFFFSIFQEFLNDVIKFEDTKLLELNAKKIKKEQTQIFEQGWLILSMISAIFASNCKC